MLCFVPSGPARKRAPSFHPGQILRIFRSSEFRAASFGYFGHMWELYTFWAFVPVILTLLPQQTANINISLWSFIIIGAGSLSCIAGGYLSEKYGSAKVAFYSLLVSATCCLLSFSLNLFTLPLALAFLVVWGVSVIADSPQFSALVAQKADPAYKGTALTIVTCIGFAITIGSLQLMKYLAEHSALSGSRFIFIILGIGPLAGLIFLFPLIKKKPDLRK